MAGPINDGAALVRKLKESGTGEAKLAVARPALSAARAAGRRATSEEVLEALEAADVNPLTLQKAWAFATTGEHVTEEVRVPAIEDTLGDAPEPKPPAGGLTVLPPVGPEKVARPDPESKPTE